MTSFNIKEILTDLFGNIRFVIALNIIIGLCILSYFLLLENKDSTIEKLNAQYNLSLEKSQIKDERIKKLKERIEFMEEKLKCSCPKVDTKQLSELKQKLDNQLETEFYKITRIYGIDNLVIGKTGSYYLIELKGAQRQQRIYFEDGEYTINSFNETFLNSLTEFRKNILDKIALSSDYSLYVKGSATSSNYTGSFVPQYEYRNIEIHPLGFSEESFLTTTVIRKINEPISNEELPNLRAKFIKEKIRRAFEYEAEILEGLPTQSLNDKDRNVSIFLFTDWE